MAGPREFVIDADATSDSEEESSSSDLFGSDEEEVSDLFKGVDALRAEFLKFCQFRGPAPVLKPIKDLISASRVEQFIRAETTLQEFYDYVTQNEIQFDYCLNARSTSGFTALIAACDTENTPIAAALIAAGVNVNQCDRNGKSPLDYAKLRKNTELVLMLDAASARAGSDCVKNQALQDNLRAAVINNDTDTCKKLLTEHQYEIDLANITIHSSHHCTREAVTHSNLELVKLLVQHGDDAMETDHMSDKNNVELARELGCNEIAEFLENNQREMYRKFKEFMENLKNAMRPMI